MATRRRYSRRELDGVRQAKGETVEAGPGGDVRPVTGPAILRREPDVIALRAGHGVPRNHEVCHPRAASVSSMACGGAGLLGAAIVPPSSDDLNSRRVAVEVVVDRKAGLIVTLERSNPICRRPRRGP